MTSKQNDTKPHKKTLKDFLQAIVLILVYMVGVAFVVYLLRIFNQ